MWIGLSLFFNITFPRGRERSNGEENGLRIPSSDFVPQLSCWLCVGYHNMLEQPTEGAHKLLYKFLLFIELPRLRNLNNWFVSSLFTVISLNGIFPTIMYPF